MSKMKSNPYVYPYAPFKSLKLAAIDAQQKTNIVEKIDISFDEVKNLLGKIDNPKIIFQGNNIEEKVFNIFLNENVLFGPKKYVVAYREYWLEKIGYFVSKNKKIRFTLLGFPFKIPVPLKTNRKYPDMGEVLILNQLAEITMVIQKIYSPGAEIVVFTEGGLGRFVGISKKEADEYKKFLATLNRKFEFSKSIKIMDLSDMEKEKDFKKLFQINKANFKNDFEKKDVDFMKKFEGAKPSMLKIINTRKFPEQMLVEAYDDAIADEKISLDGRRVREYINKKVESSLIGYFAYLRTRDDLNFLEKKVPHFLALSVSPKPKRLGIIPVNVWSDKLPYHSVPVYDAQKNKFTMEYLVDMKYGNKQYATCFLKGDGENKPFYYILNK
jgi:pyoverdine/dityrosine biosynthesis protein Dit1